MDEHIDGFLDYIKVEKNFSDYTEVNYEIDLKDYEKYLSSKRINYLNMKYKGVLEYTKYLKENKEYTPTSINRHLSSLRSFYNYLILNNKITSNPFNLIKGQKKELKLPNYMKYSEFEDMINSIPDDTLGIRNRCLFEMLFCSGARIGELININVSDIDFSNKQIKVLGKGNKERIVYLNEHAIDSIHDYLDNSRLDLLNGRKSDRLFINHIGGDLTTRGVRDIIDSIIKKAALNIKVTPHMFRHTFATMLLNEGCSLKSVQELLGHANLSTTSIYTHVSNDRIKDVYFHTHPRNKK
ncbi:MAG: tyrosine-type recombinase/integrase [Bacilli bacterium]|nr:tyrosine-type recombinase/integrase [Bacilli bacterium]